MRKLLCLFGLVLLLVLPAAAQESSPKVEVFTGFSYARVETADPSRQNLHGWNAAVQGNLAPWLGLVADVSAHYSTRTIAPGIDHNINTYQALFGPRIALPARIRPFAHALFGFARGNAALFGSTSTESAFGMALGGGVDAELSQHVSVRLIQADYLMNRFLDRNRNNFRLSAGLVFRF